MKKTIMKRIISLLAAISLVMGLAGCGGGTTAPSEQPAQQTQAEAPSKDAEPAEKVQLKFWTFHTNYEKDFMGSLGERYKEVNPNVEVIYENIPESEYMSTRLTTAFAGNAAPDIFVMSPGDFLKYANSGLAMDLTPYFTDEIKSDFLESSIDAVTVDGKIVAIPFEVEHLALYYNKDMLDAAGVAVPKTWDELTAATKKLTTDEVAGLMIEPSKGYYQNFSWYPFLWQSGGDVLDTAAKKGTFEGAAVENALKLWGDLIKAGAPSKTPKGTWEPLIGEGSAAMQISGTWLIPRLEKDFKDKNIQVAPLPIPEGGKAVTCAGGWKLMVNAKSPHAEEAAKFAMWAFAESVDLPLEWCTDVKFAYSPRKSVVEAGKDIYSQGMRKVFTEEIYDTAVGEPRYPAEIVDAVGEALQQVMFAGGNPKDEAKKANDKINEYLKTYEGSL